MAFSKDHLISDGDIEVIVRKDSALDVTEEQYNEYLKTLDESKLRIKAGEAPTRFVLRKSIPLKHSVQIENSKMSYHQGEMQPQLGFMIHEVRASLKDIKNPPQLPKDKGLEMKLTGDGLVDEKLMTDLVAANIVLDLYIARRNYLDSIGVDRQKK